MTQNSNLFMSIGRQVRDEYGRVIGKVTSFAVNPKGRVDSIYVERGDGKFAKCPTESLKVEGSDITLLSNTKTGTTALCDQIPLIWRKNRALKDLVEKEKISPEVYEDLHGSFEGVLNQLKNEAQTIIEKIERETARCIEEIKELHYALVHLEIEHEIGKIDDESYQGAFTTIQDCLKRSNKEKGDLEALKSKLSNIILGEEPPLTEQETMEEPPEESKVHEGAPTPPSPNLPEPPVVVYVKEAGESGI